MFALMQKIFKSQNLSTSKLPRRYYLRLKNMKNYLTFLPFALICLVTKIPMELVLVSLLRMTLKKMYSLESMQLISSTIAIQDFVKERICYLNCFQLKFHSQIWLWDQLTFVDMFLSSMTFQKTKIAKLSERLSTIE